MSPDPAADELLHERCVSEAMRLLEAAAARELTLRVTGSLAVRLHCASHAFLLDQMGRRRLRDIDFCGYAKQQTQLEHLFEEDGYVADPTIRQAHEWGVKRLIFSHPDTHVKIDVFMDELVMAHTIDFKGRLDVDSPTISLADLLLSKLQIHEITENDLMDSTVLLAEHELGTGDPERIDTQYVAGIMRNDWGFYYTTLDNLGKLDQALDRYEPVPEAVVEQVRGRIAGLREAIEAAPKTTRWKLRARVGTRTRWYEEVDEVDR